MRDFLVSRRARITPEQAGLPNTVAAQLTAELLGLRTSQVVVEIGDSDLPPAPQSGGSGCWRRR